MQSKLEAKHIVTIVIAICAAAVLAPVSVLAATGTLTNIVDKSDATRVAKVLQSGELAGGVRASSLSSVNVANATTGTTKLLITSVNAPSRLALTQLSLSLRNTTTATGSALVYVHSAVRASGTGTCSQYAAGTTTGFNTVVGRYLMVPLNDTVSVNWDGPAWTLFRSTTAGNPTCLLAQMVTPPASTLLYVGATYYTFVD